MNVLVTGSSGFTGTHLLRLLVAEGVQVFTHGPDEGRFGRHYDTPIYDLRALIGLVKEAQPDYVFHLAGVAKAANYAEFYLVNTLYAANLLQALQAAGRENSPVLLVGSAAEYGAVEPGQLPILEDIPPRPYSHYGVSKLAQTQLGVTLARTGRRLIMVRPFNIIGRGMGEHLSIRAFVRQVAQIVVGDRPAVMCVGNLFSSRDFIDVEETVRIYWKLLKTPTAYGQIINVCSGKPVRMKDLLDRLLELSGVSIEIQPEPSLLRGVDPSMIYGSPEKLHSILGIVPRRNIDEMLKDLLVEEVKRVRNEKKSRASLG